MYSEDLTSPIARFLAMQTDHMRNVRDNLPSGPENFKFTTPDGKANWYEFWSYIADHRPVGCVLKTDWYRIYFDDIALEWVSENLTKDPYFDKAMNKHVEEFNEYEIRAQSIRNWERYNNKK